MYQAIPLDLSSFGNKGDEDTREFFINASIFLNQNLDKETETEIQ